MRRQKTIKRPAIFEGKGIHTGRGVKVVIKSAPADTGIRFARTDLKDKPFIPADISSLSDYSNKKSACGRNFLPVSVVGISTFEIPYHRLRCTALEKGGAVIYTVEHLLAALNGLDIDNADIEIDGIEPPMLDGSALIYAEGVKSAGSAEQDKEKKQLCLEEAVWEKDGGAMLIALPDDHLRISYFLQYDESDFPAQYADFSFDSGKDKENIFLKEIAPARTFCLEKEVALIMKLGLGKGADLDTALVIKNGEPLKNKFRLKDEPARHKILDLLGDLFLLNADIKAHIIAVKSGHSLNAKFIKKLARFL